MRHEPAERIPAFTDAVVAIAMTLLILPLLDSVGEAARANHTATQWLADNAVGFVPFAISFVIISSFWRSHNRLFSVVEQIGLPLYNANMAWLTCIVIQPVTTAISGLPGRGAVQLALYAGGLALTSWMMVAMVWTLRRDPRQIRAGAAVSPRVIAGSWNTAVGFTIVLILAVVFPEIGYLWFFGMFVLTFTVRWLAKRVRPIESTAVSPEAS